MRHLARLVGALVVVLGCLSMDATAWVGPAAAQEQGAITPPAGWAEWDADGDGRLSFTEAEQMSDDDFEALRDWVSETLDRVDDNEFRAWADQHIGSPDDDFADTMRLWGTLGIPASGFVDEVREIPGEVRDTAGEVATEVVSGVSDSAFDAVATRVGEAAADLTGYIGDELARTGRPQLTADWYRVHYQRMLGWAGLLLLPLALLGIGSAAVQGDTAKVGHILMQVPIVYLLGVLAISAVSAASGLATAMARSLVPGMQESSHDLAARITEMVERGALGPGSLLLLGLLIAIAALATLVWLILAEAAIYATVLFIPLAFAGRVWEPAKDWGRKLLSIAFALVAAKVVVFAVWALAVDGLAASSSGDVPLRSALAIAALLLLTAIAPSTVMRFVPMLEGAGVAPSAGGAARSAMSTAYYGGGMARMVGIGGGGTGRSSAGGGAGGGGLGVTGRVAGAAARAPGSTGPSPTGPSSPSPQPAGQAAAGRGARGSDPSAGNRGRDGRGRDGGRSGAPRESQADPAVGGDGGGRARGSDDQPRVAPPAAPPGTGDGKPWRKGD